MPDQWLHRYQASRTFAPGQLEPVPEYEWYCTSGCKVSVEAGLHKLDGNERPYFSVTGHVQQRRPSGAYEREGSMGCVHGMLRATFPELDSVIDLHLSDDDGTPMHAVANGWYWLGRTKWVEFDATTLASYLRITEQEAKDLDEARPTEEEFSWIIDTLRPRWKAEAEAAVALLDQVRGADAMKVFAVIVTWLFLVSSTSFLLVLGGWLFLAAALYRYGTRRR